MIRRAYQASKGGPSTSIREPLTITPTPPPTSLCWRKTPPKLVLQLNIQSQTYSKTNSLITEISDSTFCRVHAVPTTPGVCYSSVGEASARVAENSKGTVKEESQFEKPEIEEKGTCTNKSTKVTFPSLNIISQAQSTSTERKFQQITIGKSTASRTFI